MKLIYKTLTPFLLIVSLFACKKSDSEITPTFDYLSSSCQISSFTHSLVSKAPLLPKYDDTGRLIEFNQELLYPLRLEKMYAFVYENNQLKKIIRPIGYDPVPGAKDFTPMEYEYGQYGVEKIHKFISVGPLYNRPDERMEFERYEFEFAGSGKPVRMKYSVNFGTTEDKFVLGTISDFKYDANGNLSEEIMQNPGGFGGSYQTRTKKYVYDDKINNSKPLYFIFFGSESHARVFSNNNLIGVNPGEPYEVKYKQSYDSDNNMTEYGYNFEKVSWNCTR